MPTAIGTSADRPALTAQLPLGARESPVMKTEDPRPQLTGTWLGPAAPLPSRAPRAVARPLPYRHHGPPQDRHLLASAPPALQSFVSDSSRGSQGIFAPRTRTRETSGNPAMPTIFSLHGSEDIPQHFGSMSSLSTQPCDSPRDNRPSPLPDLQPARTRSRTRAELVLFWEYFVYIFAVVRHSLHLRRAKHHGANNNSPRRFRTQLNNKRTGEANNSSWRRQTRLSNKRSDERRPSSNNYDGTGTASSSVPVGFIAPPDTLLSRVTM